jgi:hypothetical protein
MIVKIELNDNGGWFPGQDAKWTTGACEDCDTGEEVKVLAYSDGQYDWKVCEAHLGNGDLVRVVS